MDGGKRSYDKPPGNLDEDLLDPDELGSAPALSEPQRSAPSHSPSVPSIAPTGDQASQSELREGGPNQMSIPPVAPTGDRFVSKALVENPIAPTAESKEFDAARPAMTAGLERQCSPGPHPATTSSIVPTHAHVENPMEPSRESLNNLAVDGRRLGAGYDEPEAMSRSLKIAYVIVFGVLALSLLGVVYVHLHHSSNGHPARVSLRTTTTTLAHGGTTTVAVPTTLSPSAEGAATALVATWATNNRASALKVATPAAVATLFNVPYASGLSLDRGCSTSFSPIVCTFGPPGGASPTDPIYEIMVSEVQGGWYVSSVKIEN